MKKPDPPFERFGSRHPKGTVLFREGEIGEKMYVIRAGRVRLSRGSPGGERTVAVLGPGEFFGEMGMIANLPRIATATAAEDVELLGVDSKTVETMIRENSEIAVRMIRTLVQRLYTLTEKETFAPVNRPLAQIIEQITSRWRDATVDGNPPREIPFSISKIAVEEKTSEWVCHSIINRLAGMGLIALTEDRLRVVDATAIRELQSLLELSSQLGGT